MVSALHSGSSGPGFETWPWHCVGVKGAFVSEYSGIRMCSEIYSGYSVPGNTIAGMEIQLFRNNWASYVFDIDHPLFVKSYLS